MTTNKTNNNNIPPRHQAASSQPVYGVSTHKSGAAWGLVAGCRASYTRLAPSPWMAKALKRVAAGGR